MADHVAALNVATFIQQMIEHDMATCTENHGVLVGNLPTDYFAGVNSPIEYRIVNESGNWDAYLPPGEWQRNSFVDTYACVTFSALNVLETLIYFHTGKRVNFSDRFTAKMSGTIPNYGNYLYKVADSIRNHGVVFEEDWPAPENYDVESYYAPIPQEIKDKALKTLPSLGFDKPLYEFLSVINETELKKHLKQSPLQTTIPGHAIEEYNQIAINWNYFDTYEPFRKIESNLPQVAMKLILVPLAMDLRRADKDVYSVVDGVKSLVFNYSALKSAYGVNAPIKQVTQAELDAIPDSGITIAGLINE